VLRAKLSYGPTSADLEGERVEGWVRTSDDCGGWTRVGEAGLREREHGHLCLRESGCAGGAHFHHRTECR